MTNEMARSELEQLYMSLSEEKKKALDVAFKAMEQADRGFNEWCHDCKEYDQEKHSCPRFNRVIRETVEEIQADRDCVTCRNNDTYHCAECENKSDYEQAQADGKYDGVYISYDLISRQAVIDAIYDMEILKYRIDLEKVIKELPSVAIPTKTGHWIELETWGGRTGWRCSECRRDYNISARCSKMPYKYCPNCGSPMEIER